MQTDLQVEKRHYIEPQRRQKFGFKRFLLSVRPGIERRGDGEMAAVRTL